MAKRINNEVLLEKIEGVGKIQNMEFGHIKKELGKVNEHLRKLNSQTDKNTQFRFEQTTRNKVIYTVLTLALGAGASALAFLFT